MDEGVERKIKKSRIQYGQRGSRGGKVFGRQRQPEIYWLSLEGT